MNKGTTYFTNEPVIGPQIDVVSPEIVQVEVRRDGEVVWVNVDGVCRLRISTPKQVTIIDPRGEES